MKKWFQLKPIETKFQGYHFRSRLEARHAAFFSSLGIEYRYEDEGYDLEGTRYLPDFYLPEQDIFIEIKGQEPISDEIEKTGLLALYTGKFVFTFSGNICLPNERHQARVYCATPPVLARQRDHMEYETVRTSNDVLITLEKVDSAGFEVELDDEDNTLHLRNVRTYCGLDNGERYRTFLQYQYESLPSLIELVQENEEELKQALTCDDEWKPMFVGQGTSCWGWKWRECDECGALKICSYGDEEHRGCGGAFIDTSPRLMAAYTAARSARF